VHAVPYSVNETSTDYSRGAPLDVRTPDKLTDGIPVSPKFVSMHRVKFYVVRSLLPGVNCTWDDSHMWLAPFERNVPGKQQDNIVYIALDKPVGFAAIKLWNYSKVRNTVYSCSVWLQSAFHTWRILQTPTRGVREFMLFVDDLLVLSAELECAPKPGSDADFGHCFCFGKHHTQYRHVRASHGTAVLCYDDCRLVEGTDLGSGSPAPLARPTTSSTTACRRR
jgi:hypothetical protein